MLVFDERRRLQSDAGVYGWCNIQAAGNSKQVRRKWHGKADESKRCACATEQADRSVYEALTMMIVEFYKRNPEFVEHPERMAEHEPES